MVQIAVDKRIQFCNYIPLQEGLLSRVLNKHIKLTGKRGIQKFFMEAFFRQNHRVRREQLHSCTIPLSLQKQYTPKEQDSSASVKSLLMVNS